MVRTRGIAPAPKSHSPPSGPPGQARGSPAPQSRANELLERGVVEGGARARGWDGFLQLDPALAPPVLRPVLEPNGIGQQVGAQDQDCQGFLRAPLQAAL